MMMIRSFSRFGPTALCGGELARLVDGVFDLARDGVSLSRTTFPALNVWEDESTLFVEAELPGLTLADVEVLVRADELTIKGERKGVDAEGASYHRQERGTGSFERVIPLEVKVDAEKISATLRDGVLTISLPKAPDVLPRKIEVKG